MADSKDYYEILGVSKNATDEEIKKAYRSMAKKYHPDAQQGEQAKKDAEVKFKEINEAYSVLSDQNKRAQYDRFGSNFEQAGFGGNAGYGGFGGFDFSGFGNGMGVDIDLDDILGSVFGGGFGGFGQKSKKTGPTRGADLRYNMNISFEEAAFGTKREINVSKNEVCDVCHGSGAKPGSKVVTCDKCHGSGKVQTTQNTIMGTFATVKTCDKCGGEGKVITEPCEKCNKRGTVRKTKKITVNIPAGIDNGQAISIHGEGDCGKKGGPAGDLFVVVNVAPHKIFTRNGFDISETIKVPNIDFDTLAKSISKELDELENDSKKYDEIKVTPMSEVTKKEEPERNKEVFSSVYVREPKEVPTEKIELPKRIDLPARKSE